MSKQKKETWKSFLKSERMKDAQRQQATQRKHEKVNTKSFWQKQSFGPAPTKDQD